MINGLQLTIPGEEVRRLFEQRMEDQKSPDGWSRRNTKNAPAWDSIWNGSRRKLEKVLPKELAITAQQVERKE